MVIGIKLPKMAIEKASDTKAEDGTSEPTHEMSCAGNVSDIPMHGPESIFRSSQRRSL